jgi:hypothetical protein
MHNSLSFEENKFRTVYKILEEFGVHMKQRMSSNKGGRHSSMVWNVDFGLGGPRFESRRGREKNYYSIFFSQRDVNLLNGLDR